MLSIIFVLAFLVGSVVGASAASLVWDNGDPNPVAGYYVTWGPTKETVYSSNAPVQIPTGNCTPTSEYDCNYSIPTIPVGQTLWFTVSAYNLDGNGQPCTGGACTSAWAAPISYTNGGSGNTGTTPGVPTNVKLKP